MSTAELLVTYLVYAAGLYCSAGVVTCVALHGRGLRALDHGTDGTSHFFRALITPGLIALWPVMLMKWRRAVRGDVAVADPDRPVRAIALRRIHGVAARGLAVVLPVAIGVALLARGSGYIAASAGPLQEPAPLPRVVLETPGAFGELPIVLRVREDDANVRQIELDVERDLDRPALGLYWTSDTSSDPALGASVYLGNLWGPGTRRFAMPPDAAAADGALLIYSFIDAEVMARADLKVLSR